MDDLERFVKDKDGVVSVSELAGFLDVDEQAVRRWARDNDVRRIGATFVFNLDAARAVEEDMVGQDDDDDGDEDDDLDGDDDADGEDEVNDEAAR